MKQETHNDLLSTLTLVEANDELGRYYWIM